MAEMWGLDKDEVATYLVENKRARKALDIPEDAYLDVELLGRGEYNVNFVFLHPKTANRLLVRVNIGSQMKLDDQIGYEANALKLLSSSGRTPQLLFWDSSKEYHGKGILVEQWLPGRPLDYTTDLNIAASILADVHAVELPSTHGLFEPEDTIRNLIEECETMFDMYRQWNRADERLLTRINYLFAWVKKMSSHSNHTSRRHIINTELNARNFLINEARQSFLVDWEKPIAGNIEQDIANFLAPTTTYWKTDILLDAQTVEHFIVLYREAVNERFSTDSLNEKVREYFSVVCLRGLTWCAMAYMQHECGEREVEDSYTLMKIKDYLSEGFLDFVEQEHFPFAHDFA